MEKATINPNKKAKYEGSDEGWNVAATFVAKNTINPIREVVEKMSSKPNPAIPEIHLSLGDPTNPEYDFFPPLPGMIEAVVQSFKSGKHHGYTNSFGMAPARAALAKKYSIDSKVPLTEDDVLLTSGGCSGALEVALRTLAAAGDNILIPNPGFSIYSTVNGGCGVESREYRLLPERSWETDLDHMESQIDERTKAILVTDPSNPCGSVYSREHKEKILQVALKHHLPILSDEVYSDTVFPGVAYTSFASLSDHVPIIVCDSLGKRYLVPGWRMGWIVLHDRHDILAKEIRPGLINMTRIHLGPCGPIQGALPEILAKTPDTFFPSVAKKLQKHAEISYSALSECDGLKPVMPQGSLYMMIGIDVEVLDFKDEIHFCNCLWSEYSVRCLPGSCFQYRNFFRIVIAASEEKLKEACKRIKEFCSLHKK
eukprot:m.204162 g.204162  ORF g.204162 m.204162 type:complete len:427 (+) comp39639_c1_seq1:51-1331(+)